MLLGMIVLVMTVWVFPSALSGGVLALVVAALKLAGLRSWWVWVIASPALYFIWLISYLWFCGLGLRMIARRFPKPRRAVYPEQVSRLRGVASSLIRRTLIESLPVVSLLKETPWGSRMIVFAYSPTMHIGKGVNLGPPELLVDPEMTEIGDGVVMGNGVAIGAHFMKAQQHTKRLYVSAPVKIGARATIGAFSLISLGCTVGENAIIEPKSYLPPYTEIPPNELWGGRPAVFRRRL